MQPKKYLMILAGAGLLILISAALLLTQRYIAPKPRLTPTAPHASVTFTPSALNSAAPNDATQSAVPTRASTTYTQSGTYNYAEALQKAIYFYEAQRSGKLPANNRVSWRGDSALSDGADHGIDLTGGWYDAGDNVKFGFPMAASATLLAWGVVDYREGYTRSGQLNDMLGNLRWVMDYFIKAHSSANELWVQVGDGDVDHNWWGSAEVMQMERPSFKVDTSCPGSDVAGETSAAFAAASMAFRSTDSAYADALLQHARSLYQFADTYQGKYSDCVKAAADYYESFSGYEDELTWGALWLYRATGEESYLAKAKDYYRQLNADSKYKSAFSWDDKTLGCAVLLARITREATYQTDVERWLDYWTVGYQGERVNYTPGGLAWFNPWGTLRYTANMSFIALVYSDWVQDPAKKTRYHDFAVRQINYMLGDNPRQSSYEIGFGNNPPTQPHHRNAHGSWAADIKVPTQSRHILYGALVGGPDQQDQYSDDRTNYKTNEVATDYNAGFTSALARLVQEYGGTPLDHFPAPEARDVEFYAQARIVDQGDASATIDVVLYDHSAWPPRSSSSLSFRYFLDLSQLVAAGYDPQDVRVENMPEQGETISKLQPWNPAAHLYYVEVSFEGIPIYPGGEKVSQKETEFRISLDRQLNGFQWSPAEGWSAQGLNSAEDHTASNIAIYENGVKLAGNEPPK
jgi:hypothetical protein